jgi:triacylglycerol lipase
VTRPPIVLVPGWSDTGATLQPARRFLIDAGWPDSHVLSVDFRRRYGGNREHASELAAAVSELCTRTGTDGVAVVAHSMGGLALRYYLARLDGAAAVRTAIFVGTPHRGTWLAWLACGGGGSDMRPGSHFLQELERSTIPASVRAVCISTPIDLRVIPGSSALLEGAECHRVRLPTHSRMLRHGRTLQLIRELLLQGGPRPARSQPLH